MYSYTVPYVRLVRWVGFAIGVVVLGAGIPLLWLWLASRLETSMFQVHYLPLAVMVLGMLATYLAAIELAARLDRRDRQAQPRRPMNWNRSFSGERRVGSPTTSMERMFITATFSVGVAFEVWLFVFAGSSLPGQ
jgi:hypothetical protein